MRNSVLIADFLILSPAILAFTRVMKPEGSVWSLATFMLYPGLILIDNGHFQYNDISLGLFTLAVALILQSRELCASVAFVLALNYKQMELYHALPFFFYLLGLCFGQKNWFSTFLKLCKIGLAVIVTFGFIWWPFLQYPEQVVQVIHRIFPVNRGLFEDKVANFWCSLNVIYKLKAINQDTLVLISALVTLLTALPSNLALFWRPSKDQFILALFNTSMSFFLFSYHVHEKSILLVAFPALMAYKAIQGHRYSNFTLTWFLIVSTFSMWPLLLKDGLALATLALQGIFVTFAHYIGLLDFGAKNEGTTNLKRTSPKPLTNKDLIKGHVQDWTLWTLFNLSVIGYGTMMLASVYLLPPAKYPDLWPLMISVYSAGHFVVFWMYFLYCQFKAFQSIVTHEKKTN